MQQFLMHFDNVKFIFHFSSSSPKRKFIHQKMMLHFVWLMILLFFSNQSQDLVDSGFMGVFILFH